MMHVPEWVCEENLLACPRCRGELAMGPERLECCVCQAHFAIIDGVPHFVTLEQLDDFEAGERQFHTDIAAEADRAHGQSTLRAQQLHDGFLSPILQLPKGSVILDVACGSGVDLIRLAKLGYRVIGLDIAPGMVAVTQQKAAAAGLSEQIFLCVASAERLPFQQRRFQAAYICAALHHMQKPRAILNELARVTQEAGPVAIGSEPNAWIYRFRSLKHSRLGRRIMGLVRQDYTIGEQPPGDRNTPGWKHSDWLHITRGSPLRIVEIRPVWYLNGVASLLGLRALPGWVEQLLCRGDQALTHVPGICRLSVKWNVIAQKERGQA